MTTYQSRLYDQSRLNLRWFAMIAFAIACMALGFLSGFYASDRQQREVMLTSCVEFLDDLDASESF